MALDKRLVQRKVIVTKDADPTEVVTWSIRGINPNGQPDGSMLEIEQFQNVYRATLSRTGRKDVPVAENVAKIIYDGLEEQWEQEQWGSLERGRHSPTHLESSPDAAEEWSIDAQMAEQGIDPMEAQEKLKDYE